MIIKSNKDPVDWQAVIIYISFLLFISRLYACRYIIPDFTGMDYYGYIELAKNIFHHLDFTVRWELDSPVRYPPFFSVLIYLLTYLTRDFVASIQLISIFCASFYLVPLFSLVKNILNVYFAVLAVIFTVYYFGIQPCYLLNVDFFYSFLVIIICWLIWDTLAHRSYQAARYLLAGVLISIAYLTKFSGIIFGCAALASVLYYFVRHQRSLKDGLRYCGLILLGAAPLIITYQLLLFHGSQSKMPSIAAYAFFDGNYVYEKGWEYREEKLSELNSDATEFEYISFLKNNDDIDFILKRPSFVLDKYIWGFKKMAQEITFGVFPGGNIAKTTFYKIGPQGKTIYDLLRIGNWNGILREVSAEEVMVNPDMCLKEDAVRQAAGADFSKVWGILQRSLDSRRNITFVFQGVFLVLLIVSGVYLKWHFHMMHILLFTIGMVLIPVYFVDQRYLMPYMALYFVLWLFILAAVYRWVKKAIKIKIFLRGLALAGLLGFVSIYSMDIAKKFYQHYRYLNNAVEQNELCLKAAAWIRNDSKGLHHRAKIMACSDDYLSYLTGSDYIRLPLVIKNWDDVVNFALLKKVNYIAIDWYNLSPFLMFSDNEFKGSLSPQALVGAIKAKSPVMDKAYVPPTATAIASLNKLLEYRDLYQYMPVWPPGSVDLIHRLIAGGGYYFLELKQVNRLLIEANYPLASPHKLWLGSNENTGPGRVKRVHGIYGKNDTFWLFKI